MKVVDNRITRKDNDKSNSKPYLPNHDVDNKNIITKTKLHHITPKQDKLTYTSLKKMQDLSSMRLVERSTKRSAKFINAFLFLKTFNFTVIIVIRYQLKSLKCSFIYP